MQKILRFFTRKKNKDATITGTVDRQTQPISPQVQKNNHVMASSPAFPPQYAVGTGQSVGRSREHNEDAILSLTTTYADNGIPQALGLFIVADGMGGHSHGEIASASATRAAANFLLSNLFSEAITLSGFQPETSVQELLSKAVQAAHLAVIRHAPGGGTTMTMALTIQSQVCLAHVGDSRAYLITDDGAMQLLTTDHTLARRLVDLGQLTEEQSRTFPQKNVIYRALGQVEALTPDLITTTLPENGILMLCSDGLWGVVDEAEIARLITQTPDLVECCQKLVEAANLAGGPDNISVILVRHRH